MSTPSAVNPALEQFIRSIPLFSLVESGEINDVLRLLRPVTLKAGELLFSEGDPGKSMWILSDTSELSVSVKIPSEPKPVIVSVLKKGDVVGEMALVDDGPRSGSARVLIGGSAHQIDAQDFYAMRGMFLPAAFKVLRKICIDLCARLRATNERIVPSGKSGIQAPVLEHGPRPDMDLIERYPPFKALPAVVKLALAQKLQVVQTSEVTPLFAEGEMADGAYFIVEGEVMVGRNGKTLANLTAGNMFGVVACIDRGTRSASCITTGPALLLKMTDADFDHLFAMGHRIAFQMVDLVARQLVQHLREANAMLPIPGRAAKPITGNIAAVATAQIAEEVELDMDDALPIGVELDLSKVESRDFI